MLSFIKKMPPALDVTVLIDVFKRPQDEKQTRMLAFIRSNSYPPPPPGMFG